MLIASCVFILLGAICLIGGKVWLFQIQKEEPYKGKAIGTVADIVAGSPDEESAAGIHDYYYPLVAFYANGHLYKLQYTKGSAVSRYQVNDTLDIRYDEEEPSRFKIHVDDMKTKLAYAIYYSGFVFCCVGGIFFLLFATRY